MSLCSYVPTTDHRYVCVICGDVRPKLVNRICPGGGHMPQAVVTATKLCIHCEAFPCLGRNDCKHERAIRRGTVNCPRSVWLWV